MAARGPPGSLGTKYEIAGNLKNIITDSFGPCNYAMMEISKHLKLRTAGWCGPGCSKSRQDQFNLEFLKKERKTVIEDGICQRKFESPRDYYIRRCLLNIKMADAVVFVNPENQLSLNEIIAYCLTQDFAPLEGEFLTHPFYYWMKERIFVINDLSKEAARNLRNFLIVNPEIESLCVIGDFDIKPYSLLLFFQKAFHIRSEKLR